jgi:starch synthase
MRVLSLASEAYPLIKTGGLADVVGALPKALKSIGIEVITLIPGYRSVLPRLHKPLVIIQTTILGEEARILAYDHEGTQFFILDCPRLYDRAGGPYTDEQGQDHADNWLRFAVLAKAGALLAQGTPKGGTFDCVHAHDWQAALMPVYLRYEAPTIKSLITIHNLAFQGRFGPEIFGRLGLPDSAFGIDGIEYYQDVSFLKGGLATATKISTVSPNYAREILQPEFGQGLEGLLKAREADLSGIVNGIDHDEWNPKLDPHLMANYTPLSLKLRVKNRHHIEQVFGLKRSRGPLFCVVSRLTWQKGIDLLVDCLDDYVQKGARFALLGSGDPVLEKGILSAQERHKGRVGVKIGYDEALSHQLQGGSDAILVPSRFEPCGLTQLYGLRYGCLPVVARTGGLADTVIDANEAAIGIKAATGIVFDTVTSDGLSRALDRTIDLFHNKTTWSRMQKLAMSCDFSWSRSVSAYAKIYQSFAS